MSDVDVPPAVANVLMLSAFTLCYFPFVLSDVPLRLSYALQRLIVKVFITRFP